MQPQALLKVRDLIYSLAPDNCSVTSEYDPTDIKQVFVLSNSVTISLFSERVGDAPEIWTRPRISVDVHPGVDGLSLGRIIPIVEMICTAQAGLKLWLELEQAEVKA